MITSYAVLNDDSEFVIAYYLANDKNELRFPLFASRLDKKTGQWQNRELNDVKVVTQGTGTIWDGHSMDCIGSVLSVKEYRRRYYLNLHFNPSAGCLLILTSDLTIDQTLPGGVEEFVDGRLLWSMDMVHFADVHPEEIWIYDPNTYKSSIIYPQPNDLFRKNYEERLAQVIDQKKCMANNWACDPKRFTSNIDAIEVNEQTNSFAFNVRFEPEGFLTREEAENSGKWDDDDYVYVYKLNPVRWRAFSVYDLKAKFGTDSLLELLSPEKLRLVFPPSELLLSN